MSASIVEYSYDDDTQHLDDDEVLEIFKREKALHPDAMVVLDDLNCGHWNVEVYTSEGEKMVFLQKKVFKLLGVFLKTFKRT